MFIFIRLKLCQMGETYLLIFEFEIKHLQIFIPFPLTVNKTTIVVLTVTGNNYTRVDGDRKQL